MKRILQEPLFQFLLIGAGLFGVYAILNRAPIARPSEIVVSAAQVGQLAATFAQFRQRPATADELKGLIDQYVREEVLSREAIRLGLDQDDAIIRRRLQQKMEFIATDLASADEPSEAELAAWLASHADSFREELRLSFRQVYLNPEKHGDHLDADAANLLADLRQQPDQADTTLIGDSFLLPYEFADERQSRVAAQFGSEFADRLAALKLAEWSGPIRSGYGMHLILLTARTEGRIPTLDEVREQVTRELLNERRLEANRNFMDGLLAKYQVKFQLPRGAGNAVAETP